MHARMPDSRRDFGAARYGPGMTQSRVRVLAISGSNRTGSFNTATVQLAARGAEAAGADVRIVSMQDAPPPMFSQDIEAAAGMPENAAIWKQWFVESDALLIASPEYNGAPSPALKNVIDWVSRRAEGEPPKGAFRDKVAGLLSASPGGLGGLRGLSILRTILSGVGVLVIPEQYAVGTAHERVMPDSLDPKTVEALKGIGHRVVDVARALRIAS